MLLARGTSRESSDGVETTSANRRVNIKTRALQRSPQKVSLVGHLRLRHWYAIRCASFRMVLAGLLEERGQSLIFIDVRGAALPPECMTVGVVRVALPCPRMHYIIP